jgi:N-methylhydantoinase A
LGAAKQYSVGLDVGGTFTDVVMADRDTGFLWTAKTPSTPADPSIGFFNGIARILGLTDAGPGDVARVLHGSTVATNAVMEGKGSRTGMITTAGFKYVLEIARHDIPRKENLFGWVKPARPVRPYFIMEVPERVLLDGSVATPLDEDACRAAARRLKALDVEAVAIVFLHSYANPAHERRAAQIVVEEFPAAQISISSTVLPVFREYERAMATALNAYVQKRVGTYVGRLETGLRERGIAAPLLIMSSNGGVYGPAKAQQRPIGMALSGPAAGVIGAGFVASSAGFANAITIDIGGTSADVSVIRDGQPPVTSEGEIGPFPLSLPIIDIHTLGAGGGSLAQVTGAGGLMVGPESAGADPGPACYGRGGERPTVTDANLVLGRIPGRLLAGEMPLDARLAEAAIGRHISEPLGLSVPNAAEGIIRILNANMTGALKVVSVEKGYDPKDFTLVAFGGAGPLHAADLAAALGCDTVLIPRHPGLLCALGLLATDVQYDYARTAVQRAPDYDLAGMEAIWQELAAQAHADLAREGIAVDRRRLVRQVDLRYAKQGFELTLDAPAGRLDAAAAERFVEAFHAMHERLYTFADRTSPVEVVTLRVRAVGLVDKVVLAEIESANGSLPRITEKRSVQVGGARRADVPVYLRDALKAGHRLQGPAIIDQLDTTTLVPPELDGEVDRFGNLVLRRRAAP